MILFSVVGKDCSRDQGYKILSQILNSLKEKKKKKSAFMLSHGGN